MCHLSIYLSINWFSSTNEATLIQKIHQSYVIDEISFESSYISTSTSVIYEKDGFLWSCIRKKNRSDLRCEKKLLNLSQSILKLKESSVSSNWGKLNPRVTVKWMNTCTNKLFVSMGFHGSTPIWSKMSNRERIEFFAIIIFANSRVTRKSSPISSILFLEMQSSARIIKKPW